MLRKAAPSPGEEQRAPAATNSERALDKGRRQNGAAKAGGNGGEVPKVCLRILCDVGYIGGLIGKGGENIQKISRDTSARVLIEEHVPGSKERVVTVTGERVDRDGCNWAADGLCSVFDTVCSLSSSLSCRQPGPEGAAGGDAEARLLVDAAAVGALLCRGGASVKEVEARSGVRVRVLPRAEAPSCAGPADEVVSVGGSRQAVSAALRALGKQLKQQQQRRTSSSSAGGGGPAAINGPAGPVPIPLSPRASGGPPTPGGPGMPAAPPAPTPTPPAAPPAAAHPMAAPYHHMPMQQPGAQAMQPPGGGGGPHPAMYAQGIAGGHPAAMMGGGGYYRSAPIEVTFKLLAPEARAGVLVAHGGEVVRRIRAETDARLRLFEPHAGSPDERVVAITSMEDATSPYCAAQDALIRCVLALAGEEAASSMQRVRLLTSQASVGMVLGKRGATVTQLRQETGAAIKVLALDTPCYPDSMPSDEIIQVEGGIHTCIAALRGVATLLRGWHIKQALGISGFQGAAAAMGTAALGAHAHAHGRAGVAVGAAPGMGGLPHMVPVQVAAHPGTLAQQMHALALAPGGMGVVAYGPGGTPGMVPVMLPQSVGQPPAPQPMALGPGTPNGAYPGATVGHGSLPIPAPPPVVVFPPHAAAAATAQRGGSLGGGDRSRSSASPLTPRSGGGQLSPHLPSPSAAVAQMQMQAQGALLGAGTPPGMGAQMQHVYRYRMSNAQVGAVMGKGGQHINQIRAVSGARLQMSGPGPGGGRGGRPGASPGADDWLAAAAAAEGGRVMEICGSVEECRAAHSMVNQFLALSSCEPAYPLPDSGSPTASSTTS
eukprot:scaffold15.g4311.t1